MTQNRRNKQPLARKSTAKAILTNIHALRERRYVGDVGAIDTLLDFDTAVKHAKLTKRQAEAIRLKYDEGLTQREAAEKLGRTREDVKMALSEAITKLDDIYEMWAWMDGELSVSDFAEGDI